MQFPGKCCKVNQNGEGWLTTAPMSIRVVAIRKGIGRSPYPRPFIVCGDSCRRADVKLKQGAGVS